MRREEGRRGEERRRRQWECLCVRGGAKLPLPGD